MVFNSLSYFFFLPIVFLIYLVVSDRYRWLVLLLSSYVFYGFLLKPILLIALSAVIMLTFLIGRLIDQSADRSVRRMFLWIGVIVNLALLIYFKYLPFLTQNLNLILKSFSMGIAIDVPSSLVSIGLSFYIFQAISYLADIYFRMIKPEQHFGYFALYLAFFSKLLQGPIERGGDLLPQLKAKYEFNYDNMRSGMLLFAWGLFKKVVVADRIGLFVDPVYNDVHSFAGLPLLLATYAYAFQIFMDFSGYTDMALGSACLFNVKLTNNFNSPYLATSITDFWRRWHISLSRWILDYVFDPLQMQFRKWGKLGTTSALMVTFMTCGIWHGASWNYVIWGCIHGVYLVSAFTYKPYQKKWHKALHMNKSMWYKAWQIYITFNLVCFAFVFFRSTNLSDAIYCISHLLFATSGMDILLNEQLINLVILIVAFAAMVFVTMASHSMNIMKVWNGFALCRWTAYVILLTVLLLFYCDASKTFIYLRF